MCAGLGCINVQTDASHCGGCSNVCAPGEGCRAGRCRTLSTVRYTPSLDDRAADSWVDACAAPGHLNLLQNVDDASAMTSLPFELSFWGTRLPARSMVNVSSNGWIGLDGMMNASLAGRVTDPTPPNAVVAAQWVDLVTGPPGVCVATVGDAPSRRLAFEWIDVGYYSDRATRVTFEVVLHEGGAIELLYPRLGGRRDAEVGVESFDGVDSLSLCMPETPQCPLTSGARVRLTPTP
jgi:hypothetical protein